MSNEQNNDVARRLAHLENELRDAHARIRELARWQSDQKRRALHLQRASCGALMLCFAAALGTFYLPSVWAKPAGKPTANTGLTIRGPLVVLDSAGKIVMRVQDKSDVQSRGLVVFNAQGNAVIQATASSETGHGVLLARNGKAAVGPGAGFVFDKSGNSLLSMEGANDKAFVNLSNKGFQLMNESETVLVNLGFDNFGGLMNLCNNDGKSVVEAGSVSPNRGLVRAYPSGGQMPIPIPNFIMGSKAK